LAAQFAGFLRRLLLPEALFDVVSHFVEGPGACLLIVVLAKRHQAVKAQGEGGAVQVVVEHIVAERRAPELHLVGQPALLFRVGQPAVLRAFLFAACSVKPAGLPDLKPPIRWRRW